MGYGIVEKDGSTLRRIGGGVIRTSGDDVAGRLARIHAELASVLLEHVPDEVAFETVFTAQNPRSALLLGQSRGVALAACGAAKLVAVEYAPTEIKQAVVGYGRAEKIQVQLMVQRLLSLSEVPVSDEADALAVAICHGARAKPKLAKPVLGGPGRVRPRRGAST